MSVCLSVGLDWIWLMKYPTRIPCKTGQDRTIYWTVLYSTRSRCAHPHCRGCCHDTSCTLERIIRTDRPIATLPDLTWWCSTLTFGPSLAVWTWTQMLSPTPNPSLLCREVVVKFQICFLDWYYHARRAGLCKEKRSKSIVGITSWVKGLDWFKNREIAS